MTTTRRIACLTTVVLLAQPAAAKAGFWDQFRDDDGWFDVSNWVLDNAVGFMPLPIAITEPAVGAGVGAAAVFFHAPKNYDAGQFGGDAAGEPEFVLPNITAVAAAVTENDSWFVGGGHMAHWRNDRIRYEGVLGYGSLNLRFYGLESSSSLFDDGQRFNAEALFISQPLSIRVGTSKFFLGAEWEYVDMETTFDLGTGIPEIDELTFDTKLSGLGAFLEYDGLDNSFTPNSGINGKVSMMRRDGAIGSDWDFNELEANLLVYRKLGTKLVVGGRVEVDAVDGDVPFFLVPFIDLRGIPNMRYQGDIVVVTELEGRWALHSRFGLVGFAGIGKAADSFGDIASASSRVTRGIGLRYFVARKLGMHVGVDVARGPEDTHYYMTFGSAWN